MLRTTIMLPYILKNKALGFASKRGLSLGELIRMSLEQTLLQAKSQQSADPFFDDTNFYSGDIPTDLSAAHDEYLYAARSS